MRKAFVVSDIHGQYEHLNKLLTCWDREDDLFILGDLIDRGPDSLKVVQLIMDLKNDHGTKVTVLVGNHDIMLQNLIDNPAGEYTIYMMNGGNPTLKSFAADICNAEKTPYLVDVLRAISENHAEELAFFALRCVVV